MAPNVGGKMGSDETLEELRQTNDPLISSVTSTDLTPPRLSLIRRLLFGVAAPPLQTTGNVIGFFFNMFLLEVAKISPIQCSIIMFTGRGWDAITDPVCGYLVSLTRTRFGRCRPWLLVATPLGVACFFFLWYAPDISSQEGKFAYYLITYFAFCALITCYHVPYTSMTMLITENSSDRDQATAFRMGFEMLGTLVGTAFFGIIVTGSRVAANCGSNPDDPPTTPNPMAKVHEKNAYMAGAGCICAVYLVCGAVGFFGTKEQPGIVVERRESILRNMKEVLKFQPYIRLLLAFMFLSLAIQIVQANLAFYTTHSLNLGKVVDKGIIVVLGVAIAAVPFWYKMVIKFGKKTIFACGPIIMIPVLFVAMYAPANSPIIYFCTMGVSGLSISVAMLLPWSMLPDVIDEFMLEHGQRKESTFYSMYVFFNKFAVGISLAASTITLEIGGYKSEACKQPGTVGLALRYLMGPVPIVCLLCSLICLWSYPINEKRREQTKKAILLLATKRAEQAISSRSTVVSDLYNMAGSNNTLANGNHVVPVAEEVPAITAVPEVTHRPTTNGHGPTSTAPQLLGVRQLDNSRV